MRRVVPYGVIFGSVAAVYLAGWLGFVDRALADSRFMLVSRQAGPSVVLVEIDTATVLEAEVWPWPATHHATVLDNLVRAGARKVALDLEPDDRPDTDDDAGAARILHGIGARAVLAASPRRMRLRMNGPSPAPELDGQAVPIPDSTLAVFGTTRDPDGRVRRYAASGEYLGQTLPTLAAALADGRARGRSAPFLIDFGIDASTIPRLSYGAVLAGTFDRDVVEGRAAIVETRAPDQRTALGVPRYGTLPESVVHALAVESLASGRALRALGPGFSLLLTLALCLVVAAAERRLGWRRWAMLGAGGAAALYLLSVGLQAIAPLVVDVAPLLLAGLACCGYRAVQGLDLRPVGPAPHDKHARETETLMRHVVANSFDAIVTLKEDGTVVTFNRVAQMMFGYEEGEAIGCHVSEFIRLPHAEDQRPGRAEVRGTRRALYESEGRCKDGRRFPIELAVTWIAAESVRRRVMFMRDITERKVQQEALRYQATHDSLTDLPNRDLLQERMAEAVATARQNNWPVAFLLLDLDRFKEVNDALGHHIGDLLLRKIARRLETSVRESDTIARLGGDEFAVLMPATALDHAQQLARKLMQGLEEPFQVEGLSLSVETSVGITLFPEHGSDPPTLIRRADVAMYAAKKERSGLMLYDPEQDFTSMRLVALTGDLRRAIHDGGLHMHFQPKICARTGAPIGVEALSRWHHPAHGDIPPDEFVGLAEHSGLIQALTQWVLETALRQCAVWRNDGIDLSVSVNLSARNLLDERLPTTLVALLRSNRIPVNRLTLEITESIIMDDPRRCLEVLTQLHDVGVAISIDDFGTGYSSLGYLKKLPARELKIDKSFVLDMDQNADDRTIVHSTIELAHNLGLRVVAEGVSSRETWEELKRLGCDEGQGYWFARPMSAEALAKWYRGATREEGDTPLFLAEPAGSLVDLEQKKRNVP
jgi:diguanylate cyclase (GGDEF)-like protein/PAS domain S-box-containing protein